MERNRIVYFDLLRIWGMLWVIYMHVASSPLSEGVNTQWVLITMFTSIAYTAVPLFFMMSGYLLLTSKKTESISVLVKHRLPHLVVPLTFWNVIIACWIVFKNQEISLINIIGHVLTSFSSPLMQHLWFVYTLVTLYLISPILYFAFNSMGEKIKKYILVIMALVFLQTMITIVIPVPLEQFFRIRSISELNFLDGAFWTFVLGYFLGNMNKRIPNILLIIVAAVDWVFITVNTVLASIECGKYTGEFQNQRAGFMIVLAACIFLLFKQGIKCKRKVFPLANLSFGIYIIHNLVNRILSYIGYEAYTLMGIFGKGLVILLICYIVIKTFASIKPLCYITTGVSYEMACKCCNWQFTYNTIRGLLKNISENK